MKERFDINEYPDFLYKIESDIIKYQSISWMVKYLEDLYEVLAGYYFSCKEKIDNQRKTINELQKVRQDEVDISIGEMKFKDSVKKIQKELYNLCKDEESNKSHNIEPDVEDMKEKIMYIGGLEIEINKLKTKISTLEAIIETKNKLIQDLKRNINNIEYGLEKGKF